MQETMGEKTTISGVCTEVSERGEWVTFHVDVGSKYPVRLTTKLAPLVELGRAASKASGEMLWTYTPQEGKINPQSGQPFVNRYLEGVAPRDAASESAEQVDASVTRSESTGGMTKEEWARKDAAIHKMACIKTAAAALTHTLPSDPQLDDLNRYLERVAILSSAWHRIVLAVRDDPTGEDIPFD